MMNIRESYEKLENQILSEYACKSAESRGRAKKDAPCDVRTIFQQDRDRIIHSKSFRRLKHKTQVFISAYVGDHYRTRLTHTLEVAQISRTIARALRLNEDLTEAIALGHDLGHTPFGHAGEHALNQMTSTGFRHNEQSLRVVEVLEKKGEGLNLSWEVRDGILNHNADNIPSTLEGKIIKLADKIAYINHDIDDALRSGMLKMSEIPHHYLEVLGKSHAERINKLVMDIIINSTDKNDIYQSEIISKTMMELRAFLFRSFYMRDEIKEKMNKAEHMLKMIFEYYMSNRCNIEGLEFVETDNCERKIVDYISGMTDHYAIEEFKGIFLP